MVTSWLSLGGGLCGGVLLGAVGWIALSPPQAPLLLIEGYEYAVEGGTGAEADRAIAAALDTRAKQLLSTEMTLRVDDRVVTSSAADLGYRLRRAEALEEARRGIADAHVSPRENLGVWLLRRFSQVPESYALGLSFELDRKVAEETLETFGRLVAEHPEDAQMRIAEHRIIPSKAGRQLSVAGTIVRLETGGFLGSSLVDASVDRIEPRVTEDDLAPVDVTRVLSKYETSFRGKAGARAINIRRAGGFLDGAIILPGEQLSFNDIVGRRIHGRGFVDAPVIVNDEMEDDVGGGVCQVATTLHAAAVFANLHVVQRRSHSRPSGYAPLGLDATVIDGKVDLKLRNPYDEPLLVHVSFPSAFAIRVEILGRDSDVEVDHAYSVTHREPFTRRVWHKEEAPLGGFEQKQKGSEGMDVVSVLRIKHKDGKTDRRTYHSKYYPVPEVFYVSEGTPVASLPALPENAVGLVVNGEEIEPVAQPASTSDVPTMDEADGSDKAAPTGPKAPRDTN